MSRDRHDDARSLPPRAVAICVVEQDGWLLVTEVPDPIKGVTGYRPLGGSIETGETPRDAVVREFREEIGRDLIVDGDLGVIDNAFVYLGRPGHERISVLRGRLADPADVAAPIPWVEKRPGVEVADAGAVWIPLSAFLEGRLPLYPLGLVDLIGGGSP